MKYSKLIVDCNNLYHKNYHVHTQLEKNNVGSQIKIGGILGFLKSIEKIKSEYLTDESNVYFLFDNFASKDLQRKDLDPLYKLNRIKYEKSFYQGLDILGLILLNYNNNFYTVQMPNYEADDLVPSIIKLISNFYDRVLVLSNDMDYSRVISENVHWLSDGTLFTKESFNDQYKFYPNCNKVVMYKTIRGDSSDNIEPGIKHLGEDLVLKLVNSYDTVYDLLNDIWNIEYLSPKWKKEIKENETRLITNYQLVSFFEISEKELSKFIFKGKFNYNTLKSLYKNLINLSSSKIKIQEIDKRFLIDYENETSVNNDDFFVSPVIPRR